MSALLHISAGTENGGQELIGMLRAEGLEVLSVGAGGLPAPSEHFDIAMIGADVERPLHVARRLKDERPDAHVLFLTTAATDAALRRDLRLARIGGEWSVVMTESAVAATQAVRDALTSIAKRRKLRTTLGRMNARLVESVAAHPRPRLISDHFLASVLDQLSDAIIVLDERGIVLAFNEAASRAFGEIRRGISSIESLPSAAGDAVRAARGSRIGDESLLFSTDGSTEYNVRATRLHDAEGGLIGTALVARDVTQRRAAEKRRKLMADALRAVSSSLDPPIALQRLTEVMTRSFAEIAFVDLVQGDHVRRVGVAARTPRDAGLIERSRAFTPDVAGSHPSFRAALRGETVVQNEVTDDLLRALTTSEEHFQTLKDLDLQAFAAAPLKAGDNSVGALIVGRNRAGSFTEPEVGVLTEIARQAATALHNIWAYQAAFEANRLKDEFLATLSHELRTPMTSILGWSQILRFERSPETVLEGLKSIEVSARAQAQLIDDLLDLSRLQMGKLQVQLRTASLVEIVRAAVDTVRPTAQARGLTVTVDAPTDATIAADPSRIQQVIWNLLSNAIKFSRRGGEVRLTLSVQHSTARVTVSDDGRGIAPEFLPHVFERFRQADATTTRRYGGLGLGLSIVKQLVEMHGGTVGAENGGEGKGATFSIELPLAALVVLPAADTSDESPAPKVRLKGLSILLVEDDPSSARLLRAVLERAEARVRSASSAAGAMEALRTEIPDVLVSDIAMPDEDGLSLIRSIRGTLKVSSERLPAVALSAFTDMNLRVTVLGSGFQRFLTKPVDPEELVGTVAAVAFKPEGNEKG